MSELPNQIITNTESKEVVITPELNEAIPNILPIFDRIDQKFHEDPEAYLAGLEQSMFQFRSTEGSEVRCSLLNRNARKADELMVIFAPFSDRDPKSSAADMSEFIKYEENPGLRALTKAKPNTWSQVVKSAVTEEILAAVDHDMPILTIFSPLPTGAYSKEEKSRIRSGDFSPAARIATEAIDHAKVEMQGLYGPANIDTIHLSGASLGASNAIGAAKGLIEAGFNVDTVTTQELILGPKGLGDLAKRFTTAQYVGLDSTLQPELSLPRVSEPALRRLTERHGNEPIGMTARMLQGMKPTYMRGLTHPDTMVRTVDYLHENNTTLLAALAENSALTHETANYLRSSDTNILNIAAEYGQRVGHLADEQVALSAMVIALNIRRS
jgi:hypothetical protein